MGLVRAGSNLSSRPQTSATEENASFSSITSRSSAPSPLRSSARAVAVIGPVPMSAGSTPELARATSRSRGVSPNAAARRALVRTSAAAPSLMPLALPGVTCPSSLKAGRSVPSPSKVMSRRGCSSVAITSRLRPLTTSSGTICSAKRPSSIARSARW